VRRVMHAFVEKGAVGFCAFAFRKVTQRALGRTEAGPAPGVSGPRADSTHPFDREYGTDTSDLISGENLVSGERSDFWNPGYYGISPSGFNQIFDALDLDWPRFTFVDLGSGKGRALLLASRFPFRRIIGVELAPALSKTAAENILKFEPPWRTCRDMESLSGDATTFAYPSGPLVLYLYSPFLAPVLKRCLANLNRVLSSEPREVYLLYTNPVFESVLQKAATGFVKQWERQFTLSDEDRDADLLGTTGDRVAVYRYLP
jgi:Histone methylation protein DOT1